MVKHLALHAMGSRFSPWYMRLVSDVKDPGKALPVRVSNMTDLDRPDNLSQYKAVS